MAGTALCDVGWYRPCRHGHLVEESSAWIVGVVQVADAEVLCGQLYDVCEHPRVKPVVFEDGDFRFFLLFNWFCCFVASMLRVFDASNYRCFDAVVPNH